METTAHDTGPDSEVAETAEEAADRLWKERGKGEALHVNDLLNMLTQAESAKWFCTEYGWPPILQVAKGVRVGRWEIDVLVTHTDGSRTVIEVKDAGPISLVLAGVGQVLHYAVLLMLMEKVLKVRAALAVGDRGCLATALTCEQAGIDYIPLGTDEESRACMLAAAKKVLGQ